MEPLVSVIVPCYNAAPFLPSTVASVRAQTHARREIILVDDGSTDGSGTLADQLAGADMRVIHQANRGVCAALNRGLAEAQGDYIEYLDADDLLDPGKIRSQLLRLRSLPATALCSGSWGRFEGDPSTARFSPEAVWRDLDPVGWLVESWSGGGMMPGCAWLVSRAIVDAAGPWNESLTLINDLEYFTRVVLSATEVAFCGESRSYYRSNVQGSVSRRRGPDAWRSAFAATHMSAALLLAREDSARTRRACAANYQRLVESAYPDVPDLTGPAERRIEELGGAPLRAEGGRAFRVLCHLLGWKAARRAQLAARRVWGSNKAAPGGARDSD